jgi:tetratricopeptide (TPR) repeat protein
MVFMEWFFNPRRLTRNRTCAPHLDPLSFVHPCEHVAMTPEQVQDHWNRAQALEGAGALDGARALYAQLLASGERQAMVHLRLSTLEQSVGRYRAARQHALDAAATIAATRRWEGLPYASLRLLAFDERERVHRLLLDADWSSPKLLSQSPSLSQHLSLCGYDEEALRLLDAVAGRVPPSHLLEYSRANSLRNLGRLDEATAAYERCIALAPGFAYAHWSLAYHAVAAPADSRVPRIRSALLAARPQDLPARAHLHYALFKELDAAGETEAAWTQLQAGAELMRTMQPFDADAEAAGLAATARVPGRRPANAAEALSRVPVFIVGMPRTGTTVLERILGGHPAVADAGELNDFQHAASLASDRFVRLPLGVDDVAALSNVDPRGIGQSYLERTGRHYGTRSHLIDKNPQNIFAAGLIAEALPQARILCLVREPADACFSNLKELFAPGSYGYSYDPVAVADHYARFRRLAGFWSESLPGQFLEVSYEALVADPARVSTAVMEFCGLPAELGCVDITRNLSPASTASSSQVRQPIHGRNVGAWRRYRRQLQPMLERLRGHGFDVDAAP